MSNLWREYCKILDILPEIITEDERKKSIKAAKHALRTFIQEFKLAYQNWIPQQDLPPAPSRRGAMIKETPPTPPEAENIVANVKGHPISFIKGIMATFKEVLAKIIEGKFSRRNNFFRIAF